MEILPLTGALGAEIRGADIKNPNDIPLIKEAFSKYSVLIIREQDIQPEDHLTFARNWGEINVNRFFKPLDNHPEIAIVLKEPDQTDAIGEQWHTDHAYDQIPALGSILHAIETPAFGGDTVFCSMGAAYSDLSPKFKTLIHDLRAWHSSRHVFGASQSQTETTKTGRIGNADKATQDALHPVVIQHPLSGRPGLYVNPQFTTHIDGLNKIESKAILSALFEHCAQPEYQCRIRWNAGDVAMWDNRATWHKAINDYHGHRRFMHRVTIEGTPLLPAK